MGVWVDTDFGFDDLWALLLLKHLDITVDGVSLVAGNVPLVQVIRNASAAMRAFNFTWPVYAGADRPLQREPETAERILGPYGMQTRGLLLPYDESPAACLQPQPAKDALSDWLQGAGPHSVLALGPITNLAQLQKDYPQAAQNIEQLTWLGGSRGRGNHSEYAEYNALADPEALAIIDDSDTPFRMIDLELCRRVGFGESDLPVMQGGNRQLLSDLLGGYLDIALQRGRSHMSIYDPLAALAVASSELFEFAPGTLVVNTQASVRYGQTSVCETDTHTGFEYAAEIDTERARRICLSALNTA